MSDTDAYQAAVNKLMIYIDQTVNFAQGQLPDIANEMLTYNTSLDFLWLGIGALFVMLGAVMFILGKAACDCEGITFFGGLIFVIAVLFIGIDLTDLMKIHQAPKLYIMDELASRIKTTK